MPASSSRTDLTATSSSSRSRMVVRAFSGSFQNSRDSVCAVSASRRSSAVSQSKMPPQQGQNLLDFGDGLFNFRTHGAIPLFAALRLADAPPPSNLALALGEFSDCRIAFQTRQPIEKKLAVHLIDLMLSHAGGKALKPQCLPRAR